MVNITSNVTYVDFSKLSQYNESTPKINITDFSNIQNDIFGVLANYTELQWFLSIVIFIGLFLIIRKIQFVDLSESQIAIVCSFVVMAMNVLLLVMNVFTIIQPFQLFTVIWLILVIGVIAHKRRV